MKGQSNRQKTISEQMRPTRLRSLAPRDIRRPKTRRPRSEKPRSR
jgi:hypothetical protein